MAELVSNIIPYFPASKLASLAIWFAYNAQYRQNVACTQNVNLEFMTYRITAHISQLLFNTACMGGR